MTRIGLAAWLVAIALGGATAAFGQSIASQAPATGTAAPVAAPGERQPQQKSQTPAPSSVDQHGESAYPNHRFWNRQNGWLFAGVGASRTLDYLSTLNMRHRGRQEILLTNDLVDNHAAFAAVEAAGTGLSIGASYLFHRYHHHALERWTSYVHIGLATSGAVRNYCLKTAHPAPAVPHP